MPLNGNNYHLGNMHATIHRHDTRTHTCSCILGADPYLPASALVTCMERDSRYSDGLLEFHNSDVLWDFAISSAIDLCCHAVVICHEGYSHTDELMLNHLLHMGIYDWDGADRSGGGPSPPIAIRYTVALGNSLLVHMELSWPLPSLLLQRMVPR